LFPVMTYKETLEYIYAKLPMFHRIGPAAFRNDLTNTIRLLDELGNPQHKFKSIHIAGTNGKGSVSHLIAAVLQSAGYKTGLYTSPHYKDFRERIKLNGEMVSEEFVMDFVERIRSMVEEIQPSFFEITVAMAFDYFAKQEVDFAVIETGLGGRLDSTNVITPILSVITNISYDHQNFLGDTLQLIAKEKAGIIKTNILVVIGETQEEVKDVFIQQAKEKNAAISFADQIFRCNLIDEDSDKLVLNVKDKTKDQSYELESQLTGPYQVKNIQTVLQTIEQLKNQGIKISDEHRSNGIANVVDLTGMLGRWMILCKNPLIIADGVHNVGGFENVLPKIKSIPHRQLHFVFGTVSDKDISPILNLLPRNAIYYFCKADIPRAKNPDELKSEAERFDLNGEKYSSVKEAFEVAKKNAGADDLVFIGGSIFVVAEVI